MGHGCETSDVILRKGQKDNRRISDSSTENNDDSTNTVAKSFATTILPSLRETANQLAKQVGFFRKHAPDIAQLHNFPYSSLPSYCNDNFNNRDGSESNKDETKTAKLFEQNKRLVRDVEHFPLLPKKGRLQVPIALVFEMEDYGPHGKLVVVNYWRQLKACRQRELKIIMQRFYVRPNVNNERLNLSPTVVPRMILPSTMATNQCELQACSREELGRLRELTDIPWGFRCVETVVQLAEKLGLCPRGGNPKNACDMLWTANLEAPSTECKVEDCVYPAMARNHGYCCRHGLHFGPTAGKAHGRRGYFLLGDIYTRPYVTIRNPNETKSLVQKVGNASTAVITKKLSTCSCRNETCVGIGYSPTMIPFDIHRFPKALRKQIWSNPEGLNMTTRTQFQISHNKSENENTEFFRSSVLRLAPWHFHPEHREILPNGTWKLLDSLRRPSLPTNGNALEGDQTTSNEWNGLPLPTYSPSDFLEEPAMKEYAARKATVASTTNILPSWCREYLRLEEGPSDIAEIQRNYLWDRTIELEKELASRIVSFRSKERAFEIELQKVQSKYNEKKFLKRRDKKRKRNDSNNKDNHKINNAKSGNPSSPHVLQDISKNKGGKKNCIESMKIAGHDGRAESRIETTNDSLQHDSSSARKPVRRRGSQPIGPVHYLEQAQQHPQHHQQHHQQHHLHHPYSHSYHLHPQHHARHEHAHPNRSTNMDIRQLPPQRYHRHQQRPQHQHQHQPPEEPYPHHNHGYHPQHDDRDERYREHPTESQKQQHQGYHPQNGEREDQYRKHPSGHPPEPQTQQQEQPQQHQQRQQRPPHYTEQQDWQRTYYK